jgi:hypothetical protein
LENTVTHGKACSVSRSVLNHGLSLPQMGSCNIALPTRTQAIFLFDSHCLESIRSAAASCSKSWCSCSPSGRESGRDIAPFSVIVV